MLRQSKEKKRNGVTHTDFAFASIIHLEANKRNVSVGNQSPLCFPYALTLIRLNTLFFSFFFPFSFFLLLLQKKRMYDGWNDEMTKRIENKNKGKGEK